MNKFLRLSVILAMICYSLTVFARDFEYTYEGQTLTYTVIDEEAKTVKTKDGELGSGSAGNEVSGDLIIPSTVSDSGTEYTVTSIGESAFYSCSSMTSVTIPNSVTSIGDKAFYGCSGLVKSAYPNTISCPFGNGITIAYNPKDTKIENGCIYDSNIVYFIPFSFTGEFIIPETISKIGDNSFYGCKGLTSVIIPGSVTSIGGSAFEGCKNLTTIYSYNTTPPTTGNDAFNEVPYDAIVYVPKGRALAYSNHSGWKAFYDFREMGVLAITLNKNSFSLKINETETIIANISNPDNVGIKSEEWASTNPAVAKVENGVVTAVSAGVATINYIVTDENSMTYYASCTVTVTDTNSVDSIYIDEDADVEIYTLRGIKINNRNNLPQGVYIMRKGNETKKVIVK